MVAFLDFEFNQGPTVPKEEIISVGCVIYNDNLEEIDSFYSLCHPRIHKKLQYRVAEITKISQRELNSAPNFVRMANEFIKILKKYKNLTFYSWGRDDWNVFKDTCQLNNCMWFRRYIPYIKDLQNDIFNSIKNGDRKLFKNTKNLAITSNFYNQKNLPAHNALNDARMLGYIYKAYITRGIYDYSKNTFEIMDNVTDDDINVAYEVATKLKKDELLVTVNRLKTIYSPSYKRLLNGNIYHVIEPLLDSPVFIKKRGRDYKKYSIELLLDESEYCMWIIIKSSDFLLKQKLDIDLQYENIVRLLRMFSGKKKKYHRYKKRK